MHRFIDKLDKEWRLILKKASPVNHISPEKNMYDAIITLQYHSALSKWKGNFISLHNIFSYMSVFFVIFIVIKLARLFPPKSLSSISVRNGIIAHYCFNVKPSNFETLSHLAYR